jgi:hypothetical protein
MQVVDYTQTFAALRAYAKRLGTEDINEAIASVDTLTYLTFCSPLPSALLSPPLPFLPLPSPFPLPALSR